MDKTILLTVNYKGRPLEIVKSLVPNGFKLVTMETMNHKELVEKSVDADYILASGHLKIDKEVISVARKLKMVQRMGVGLDSLDLAGLNSKSIQVYVNQGINAGSVSEHVVMLILACLRKLTLINVNTKNGLWEKQEQGVTTRELAKQVVGIIGMGNIGKRVARLLKPFGCKIIYYSNPRLSSDEEEKIGVHYIDEEGLYKTADIITLHLPLNNETESMICMHTLKKMTDGVIIINTSRGGLINEPDLLECLISGKVGFAGLDVYREEPVKNTRLIKHEHVICTPHIAGNTYDSFIRMMVCAFENIVNFDKKNFEAIEHNRVIQ